MSSQKLRFLRSRGYDGQVVRSGATIEVSEFWAKIFINDGTAVPFETQNEAVTPKSPGPKKKGRK